MFSLLLKDLISDFYLSSLFYFLNTFACNVAWGNNLDKNTLDHFRVYLKSQLFLATVKACCLSRSVVKLNIIIFLTRYDYVIAYRYI